MTFFSPAAAMMTVCVLFHCISHLHVLLNPTCRTCPAVIPGPRIINGTRMSNSYICRLSYGNDSWPTTWTPNHTRIHFFIWPSFPKLLQVRRGHQTRTFEDNWNEEPCREDVWWKNRSIFHLHNAFYNSYQTEMTKLTQCYLLTQKLWRLPEKFATQLSTRHRASTSTRWHFAFGTMSS